MKDCIRLQHSAVSYNEPPPSPYLLMSHYSSHTVTVDTNHPNIQHLIIYERRENVFSCMPQVGY